MIQILESTLDKATKDATSNPRKGGGDVKGGPRGAALLIAVKDKQIKAARKKAEMYRRANTDLKRQLARVVNHDVMSTLENSVKEKDLRIAKLRDDNRTLMHVTRQQTKIITDQDSSQDNWPAKIASLMDQVRTGKEKLRKYHEADEKAKVHAGPCFCLAPRTAVVVCPRGSC